MDVDRNGFEIIGREECVRLLASSTIGRIGLTQGALPTVVPVNFLLHDDHIVFRTRRGAKLDAATDGTVVAFETDRIDPFSHTGWSVVVTGVATEITDPGEVAQAELLPIAHWGPRVADRFVRISTELVSGRRIPGPGTPAVIPPAHAGHTALV